MTGAHVVVVGNEKGGSGKTTASVHIAVALSRLGIAWPQSISTRGSAALRGIWKTGLLAQPCDSRLAMPETLPFCPPKGTRSTRRWPTMRGASPS